MRAFSDKLIETIEKHTEEIAQQWCKAVRKNPRTTTYQAISVDKCVQQGIDLYKNMRRLYYSERPYKEIDEYFTKIAQRQYSEGIPLHEALYALILLRRHIWIFAEFQAIFITTLDMHQAVESINRTIRIFDRGTYIMARTYQESSKC